MMETTRIGWKTPEGVAIVRCLYGEMIAKGLLSMAYELHDAVEFNEPYNVGLKLFDILSTDQKVWLHYELARDLFDFQSKSQPRTVLIDATAAGIFHEIEENIKLEIEEAMNNSPDQSFEWRTTVHSVLKVFLLSSFADVKDGTIPQSIDCKDVMLWRNAVEILKQRMLYNTRFDIEEYLKGELEKGTILQAIVSVNEPYYTSRPEVPEDFNAKKILKESMLLCERTTKDFVTHRKKNAERRRKAVDLVSENQSNPVTGPQKMPLSKWNKYIPVAFSIDAIAEKTIVPSCQWVDLVLSVFRCLHTHDPSVIEAIQKDTDLGRFLTMFPETRYEPQLVTENIFIERYRFTIFRDRMLQNWFHYYNVPFSSLKVWLKPVEKKKLSQPIVERKGRRKATVSMSPKDIHGKQQHTSVSKDSPIDSAFQHWLSWRELKNRSLCEICLDVARFYRSIMPTVITDRDMQFKVIKCLDVAESHAFGNVDAKAVRQAIADSLAYTKTMKGQGPNDKSLRLIKAASTAAGDIAKSIMQTVKAVLAEEKAKAAFTDEASDYSNVYDDAYAATVDEAAEKNLDFGDLRKTAEKAVRQAKSKNGDYGQADEKALAAKHQAIASIFRAINSVSKAVGVAEIDYQKFISNQKWKLGSWACSCNDNECSSTPE